MEPFKLALREPLKLESGLHNAPKAGSSNGAKLERLKNYVVSNKAVGVPDDQF